jgi:hypothetical protein
VSHLSKRSIILIRAIGFATGDTKSPLVPGFGRKYLDCDVVSKRPYEYLATAHIDPIYIMLKTVVASAAATKALHSDIARDQCFATR